MHREVFCIIILNVDLKTDNSDFQAEDEYFSGVGSYPFQEPSRDETDNSQFSPEAVAAVEAILQSTSPTTSTALTTSRAPSGERNTHEELRVDPEAFKVKLDVLISVNQPI